MWHYPNTSQKRANWSVVSHDRATRLSFSNTESITKIQGLQNSLQVIDNEFEINSELLCINLKSPLNFDFGIK